MSANEKPLGVAIVVCDKIITEAVTNNKTLVSIFNTITAETFPCRHDRMSVFVSLTNGQGNKDVKLSLKRTGTEETLVTLGGEIPFQDPNQVVELIFAIKNTTFLEPGVYSFEVYVDDEYIFESRLNAKKP